MYSDASAYRRTRCVHIFAVCCTTTALLAGCGSGGGNSLNSTAVSITSDNAPQAAGANYETLNGINGSTGATTGASALSVAVSGDGKTSSLVDFVVHQVIRVSNLDQGSRTDSVTLPTQTIACDTPSGGGAAGDYTFSATDTSIDITFSNCYLSSDGETTDGKIDMSNVKYSTPDSNNPNAYNVSAGVSVSKLKVTDTTGARTYDGKFSLKSSTTDSVTFDSSITGSSLTDKNDSGLSLALEDFDLTESEDDNTLTYSEYGTGKVTDSDLKGYTKFQIPQNAPLVGSLSARFPSSGTMVITGAGDSTVTLTTIDSTSVQLATDSNGDGQVDNTTTKPWTDLVP